MANAHAAMSPSQLSRIIACPASVKMCEQYPSFGSSKYASEGTQLHDIMAEVVRMRTSGKNGSPDKLLAELSQEQLMLVNQCITYFDSVYNPNMTLAIEAKTTLAPWSAPQVYGTPDIAMADVASSTLHILDWKFGGGVFVAVEDNVQLKAYALGKLAEMALFDLQQVTLHIVQPRLENFKAWTLSKQDLLDWLHNELMPTIKNAESEQPTFNPGASQCRWCSAAGMCLARMEHHQHMASEVFKFCDEHADVLKNGISAEDEAATLALVEAFKQLDELESSIAEIKAMAFKRASIGQFPGYKVVNGRSSRRWAAPELEVVRALEAAGIEPYETKLISVAQAEKLGMKKVDGFSNLYMKALGKPVMVHDSDSREPITTVETTFGAFADSAED